MDDKARDSLLEGLVSKLEANKSACEKAVDAVFELKTKLDNFQRVDESLTAEVKEIRAEVSTMRRERSAAPLVAITLSGVALIVSLIALGGMFWMYGKQSVAGRAIQADPAAYADAQR